MFRKIFTKEIKKLLSSKSFLIYLFLIYLPLIISIWFSYQMHHDVTIIENLTQFLPEPITEVSPKIALMTHLDLSMISIALVAIIHMTKTIAGEKEEGTMSLLVSKPIKRSRILLAKWSSFLLVYSLLLASSVAIMAISIYYIGIGLVSSEIFLAYLIATLLFGFVYTNIATLFSSLTDKSRHSNLFSFIFLIGWMTLDFINTYLPMDLKDYVEEISLSHHINKVIGYITQKEAALFAAGAEAIYPTDLSFYYTISAILLVTTLIPLLLSVYVFNKQDI